MKKTFVFAIALLLSGPYIHLSACTTAIISGKSTPGGKPIMWKQRDTDSDKNKLLYFTGSRYDFIGMVSAGNTEKSRVWMGMNHEGFCIMNSASYNINPEKTDSGRYGEGSVMAMALSVCATLEDFEHLLDSLIRPTGLAANFGVIDAQGGAAYYEVGQNHWVKIDVNDQTVAPLGYVIRTNYSFTGDPETGQGYARYITASNIFYKAAMTNRLSVETILSGAVRSLVNGFTGDNLLDRATGQDQVRMVHFRDNIARRTSVSSVIFEGVKPGEDPMATVMWSITGWPLATVAYPVWMNKEQFIPALLTGPEGKESPLCTVSLAAKKEAMPITRGHGQEYLDINKVYNTDHTGYLQWILPLEEEIIALYREKSPLWKNQVPSSRELMELYELIDRKILETYPTHFPETRLNML